MRQLTKLSVIETLTYEESEIRLILLGVISSICLVTCATAFALIVNRISGYFKDPIVVPYQSPSYQTIGFPIPTILVIDHTGSFLTYSPVTNKLRRSLPGLDQLISVQSMKAGIKTHTPIFCTEYNQNLYFMYPHPEKPVVKYNLQGGYHRIIPRSYPSNYHILKPIGIQVGGYYWILFGADLTKKQVHFASYPTQEKSSLWSLKKETWMDGPDLRHLPKMDQEYYCAVASDRNTAYILIDVYLQKYNFQQNQWTNLTNMEPFQELLSNVKRGTVYTLALLRQFPICTLYQDKDYSKHIFVQAGMMIELFGNEVTWKMQRYDIEQDLWTSSIVTASKPIKFGGLTTVINGNVFHIPQSQNDLEISQIMIKDNYTHQFLLQQGTVDLFPTQQMYQTVSVYYSRKYTHN